jgi:hypothetical protein
VVPNAQPEHTSKKALLTETGLPEASNEMFLSAGIPPAPV